MIKLVSFRALDVPYFPNQFLGFNFLLRDGSNCIQFGTFKNKWLFWSTAWNLIFWVTKCLLLCSSINIFLSVLISYFIFFQNSRYIAIAWFQFSWLQHFQQESHKLVSKWLFSYDSQNIFVWLLVKLWVQVLS